MNVEGDTMLKNDKTIIINVNDLDTKYLRSGKGIEGIVYEYTPDKVIKILDPKEVSIESVMNRVHYFINVKIDNVIFPEDTVLDDKGNVLGYSMKNVRTNKYKSFFNLLECLDNKEFVDYFIKAQETMKKLHDKNIFIGDFNPNNIMIDEDDNPVFIDTINYATEEFSFTFIPFSAMLFEHIFNKKIELLDNDIFMFTFLFLSYYISFDDLIEAVNNPDNFKNIIDKFNIRDESKKILKDIFSLNGKKNYIDDILKDFRENEHVKYDNKYGFLIKTIFK